MTPTWSLHSCSNSLNPLFTLLRDHLNKLVIPAKAGTHTTPTYRNFRPGDVRHSQADISKAQRLALAMPWYVEQTR